MGQDSRFRCLEAGDEYFSTNKLRHANLPSPRATRPATPGAKTADMVHPRHRYVGPWRHCARNLDFANTISRKHVARQFLLAVGD